jgi:polyisoprenoid-binding protein YceI
MSTTSTTTKTKWIIDPIHSEIGFKVRHLMITNVKGSFREYEASIYTEGEDFTTAQIHVVVNPASITTGDESRDAHLKSADFFDVENFPQIHFTSDDAYERVDNDGSYELYGDLTIKGIQKQIKLSIEFGGLMKDPWGNTKAGITVNGKINRKDWNLNWNTALETGGVLVSEEIHISCEIQLVKQAPAL